LDETVRATGPVRPDTSWSMQRHFWAFFGEKLFELNLVTDDLMLTRLKFEAASKEFEEIGKEDLKELVVDDQKAGW
jgi:hypothetical protein